MIQADFVLQQFLAVAVAWTVCGILTAAGAFTDDPSDPGYRARTDARASAVTDIPFFYFPYPCA